MFQIQVFQLIVLMVTIQLTASYLRSSFIRSSVNLNTVRHSSIKSTLAEPDLPSISREIASINSLSFQSTLDTKEFVTDRKDLTIFVVDSSMPGGIQRINSVKGAVSRTIPFEKAAVIACFGGSAEVVLEPTSSLSLANRKLVNLKKSVMGNLGVGLQKAIDIINQESPNGSKDITVVILADGKAHGLVSGTSECYIETTDVCDDLLYESAQMLSSLKSQSKSNNTKLNIVVIDTEESKISTSSFGEGSRLAIASDASYYRVPNLSDTSLSKLIKDIKSKE